MLIRLLSYLFIVPVIGACSSPGSQKYSYRLSVQKSVVLPAIAGSSGLVLHQGKAIIISDNMPGYVTMDTADLSHVFYSFRPGAIPEPQDKNIKEDLENACIASISGKPYVVAFGSGSVEGPREKILYFSPDTLSQHTIKSSSILYSTIKRRLGISTAQLNIEGSFSTADSFYLFNRGTNHLIAMSLATLGHVLTHDTYRPPALNTRSYSLPVSDSFPIAFSGACFYKEDKFLFTASVEKTSNWIADGEVGGSWVGMASLDGTIHFLLPLQDDRGNPQKQKLESLDIIKEDAHGNLQLSAVADNDNGQSTWFRLLLYKE